MRTWILLGVTALILIAYAAGCCGTPTPTPPAPMQVVRPARPALPEPILLAGEILGAQLEPLHLATLAQLEDYRSALRQLEGRQVYVISAAELDELTARQRGYVRQLEAAPFWRSSP